MQVEMLKPVMDAETGESLPGMSELIRTELCPRVVSIDLKGEYPREFMHKLGAIGGFGAMVAPQFGGTGFGLKNAIRIIEDVSRECVSTGFMVWAQYACAWYLQNSSNLAIRRDVLPLIAKGIALGGTGQSNAMKSCAAIEDNRLTAKRIDGGYLVNGTLPWVSNIGIDHYFHVGIDVDNEPGLLIALVKGDHPGLTLNQNAHFIAMEGTNTFACNFKEVFIPNEAVVSHPSEFTQFKSRTKAAFILMQMGMGLGLIDACVSMMKRSNKTHGHVNCFLDDQAEDIESELLAARAACYRLADKIDAMPDGDHERETLALRLAGGELSLKAANSAMLHLGAKGYLVGNAAQRRVREAYFIAIVTPAIKHLRKELHDIDTGSCTCTA
ncbi:MAG: acyl-CoA/acyl-ACP dehydrogenase [Sulfuriferula sp.]|nr:acyl-CoA/acyl-ACP dehydrogenase [Sulfuriferula sp.]